MNWFNEWKVIVNNFNKTLTLFIWKVENLFVYLLCKIERDKTLNYKNPNYEKY